MERVDPSEEWTTTTTGLKSDTAPSPSEVDHARSLAFPDGFAVESASAAYMPASLRTPHSH